MSQESVQNSSAFLGAILNENTGNKDNSIDNMDLTVMEVVLVMIGQIVT